MPRLSIEEAIKSSSSADRQGGRVTVAGFVRSLRLQKAICFIDLVDRSGQLQLVCNVDSSGFELCKDLALESVVEATGKLQAKPPKKDSQAKEYEILVEDLQILSAAAPELPIPILQKADNEADAENRFNWRWLDLRDPLKQKIFQVWTELEKGFRVYWQQAGYLQIYTPSFMNTASESGAEVFSVKYFDRTAYLAQSPQFYKQMAMAAGLEKVFCVGPVYRAEKSNTFRHATEFTGWDFEISYIESEAIVMQELTNMIYAGLAQVKESLDLEINLPQLPLPRLTMKQAKERLETAKIKSDTPDDFNSEEERALGEIIKQETNSDFCFVTDYPITARPFYHMRQADDPSLTKSFDLFYKGLEIVTGAQREHRYDILRQQAKEKGMDEKSLEDYFNFFKYGCPPHGGAGIGPARIVMKLLDLPNIREAVFLPRDVRHLRP